MIQAMGRYRTTSKNPGYSAVHLEYEFCSESLQILVLLDDHGWNDQLKNGGFEDWFEAARLGITYAMKCVYQEFGLFHIKRIVGMICDTDKFHVAYAAALATWNALSYQPPLDHETLLSEMKSLTNTH